DSALDGLVILDERGLCVEANPAALTVLGVMREDLIGHPIRDFLVDLDVSGRSDHQGEFQVLGRDRRPVFIEYSVTTNYLPGRHSLVLRDISTRKQAEAELRESREQFVEMADHIAEVFWTLDARSKRVIYVNPAFEALTGRPLETLSANPACYQELFHPEDS